MCTAVDITAQEAFFGLVETHCLIPKSVLFIPYHTSPAHHPTPPQIYKQRFGWCRRSRRAHRPRLIEVEDDQNENANNLCSAE